ncbi:MAG: tetratricopeptide repeat protein [Candidatus Marinimicrobia bacterium]|nr:tetratricopeptide repeat protein [Candidatus Neomarinimicrobiota bacterium]
MSIPEYSILSAVLAANFAIRMRFRGLPLDWDHGVYGYMNYWYKKMGKNIIPGAGGNESLINWGKPGMTYIFWLIVTLCGTNPRRIRVFDSVWYLMNTLGVFWLGLTAFGTTEGLIAAGLYAFYSSLPFTWTADLNAENYQTLFITLSIGSFTLFMQTGSQFYLVLAGFSGFLTMLLKQSSAPYFLSYFVYTAYINSDLTNFSLLFAAFALPYMLFFSFYLLKGVKFSHLMHVFLIRPTIRGLSYVLDRLPENGKWVKSERHSHKWEQLRLNLRSHLLEAAPIWIIGSAGLTMLLLKPTQPPNFILTTLFAGMVIGYWLPQKFYAYYLIPFIPLFAVTGGYLIFSAIEPSTGSQLRFATYTLSFASVAFVFALPRLYRFFVRMNSTEQALYQYRHSLPNFLASEEIAEYVKSKTSPEDYIFVWSVNPEIYFLSERRSAIGHLQVGEDSIRSIAMRDMDDFLNRMFKDIALNKTKLIIMVSGGLSIEELQTQTHLKYKQDQLFDTRLPNVEDRKYVAYSLVEESYETALNELGEIAFAEENFDDAKAYFRRAIEESSSNSAAYTNLATVLWQTGNKDEARKMLNKSLELDPLSKDTILSYADIARSEDELRMAAEHCNFYIKEKGADAEISSLLNRLAQKPE